jgi:hypothetical protein
MTEDPHVVFSISITASLKKFVDQRTKWLRIGRSDYFKYWLESERDKGIDAPFTIERKPIKENLATAYG